MRISKRLQEVNNLEDHCVSSETAQYDGHLPLFGRPFVKRFAVYYHTVVLFVTLVYCGQTVGWMKMKLGLEVGLNPHDIMLDVDPTSPLPPKK